MAAEIEIKFPCASGCLPTTNAQVSGRYRFSTNVLIPPVEKALPGDAAPPPNRFKVVAKVGADPAREVWVPYSEVWNNWAVDFPALTTATDVTVTAKLVDTLGTGGPVDLAFDDVDHVNVTGLCITDPVIGGGGGSAAVGATSTAPLVGGNAPAPVPRFHHMTVRTKYPVVPGGNDQIHRVVAIVTRVDVKPKKTTREVWASVEAILQAGVASAIIPIPPAGTDSKYYEYHFVQMINTTNAMHFRTLAVRL